MPNEALRFLVSIAQHPDQLQAYFADPSATAKDFGVPETQLQGIISGDPVQVAVAMGIDVGAEQAGELFWLPVFVPEGATPPPGAVREPHTASDESKENV